MAETPLAHVDANVILRFLLGEPERQARKAEALFQRASQGGLSIRIYPAVLAEVVYVLTSPKLAGFPRTKVVGVLRELLTLHGVETVDLDVVLGALQRFEETRLDWVDCLLLAFSPEIPVYTFDQAMIAAGGYLPLE